MKTGHAFGEHIKTEKIKKRRYSDGPTNQTMRGFLLPLTLFAAGLLLVGRLFYLQIIKGADYKVLSDSNRIRTQIIHAPRGVIFDRFGVPLVQNVPGFRQVVKELTNCKSGAKESGKNNKKAICETESSIPLSQEQALPLLAQGTKNLEVASLRNYVYKDSLGHVLGYIGQISKEELANPQFADYRGTDWVGKNGIEREYEQTLRGVDGKELIEVDATGKAVRPLGVTDPIAGQDITLTIDSKLQKAVYDATKEVKKGAVIVSNPKGEILAMISRPSFDPNLFTLDKTYKTASDSAYKSLTEVLSDSTYYPLLDRVIAGTYPPGSTFKIVTSAAGLQDNIIDENYKITDTGVITIGDFSFANWYYTDYGRRESGDLNVVRAIARSNDIFFYKLAEKVGVDKLSEMSRKMGLGVKTGIDLGGEVSGLVPTVEWKKDIFKENWYLGDTYHYGIGQGYLLTTPLQVNQWTQVIANGGSLYEPHLLLDQRSSFGRLRTSKIKDQKILNDKTIGLIRQGMIEACSTGGVAWPLFNFKVTNPNLKIDGKNIMEVKEASGSAKPKDLRAISVACKTGTAQHGGEDTLPHAWITLFAPAYNPEIVITVLKEESGEGSNEAAPIAKKILESYFGK
ncbi:MAG TPA: penicillin-binding protein 2 [Candidatus Saccharimonadales bacterium]|nr:penicillin-binding protein 2 [Candidatus Saccharimonadales bacterium]